MGIGAENRCELLNYWNCKIRFVSDFALHYLPVPGFYTTSYNGLLGL